MRKLWFITDILPAAVAATLRIVGRLGTPKDGPEPTRTPSINGCGHWWILLPVLWRKIHGKVDQKYGKRGEEIIERDEINT